MSEPEERTIEVGALARVEGEGALKVRLRGSTIEQVRLEIFEPPRFFEAFLRGRSYLEAPDVTARICGICPVAYQMSAVHALEDALGIHVGPGIAELRRLLYCGEWIESHTLHAFMLHAPDFLGLPDAVALAQEAPDMVERGLAIKKTGNALVALLGGREIHPVNVRVGGFYRLPTRAELESLVPDLERARDETRVALRWAAGLTFPERQSGLELVALRHPDEYPMNRGRLVSNHGLDLDVQDWDEHFEEYQVEHSTALWARLKARVSANGGGGHYLTGPLARYSLNFDRLSPLAQEAAIEAGLGSVCLNPFQSILVRLVEVLYACDEALRLIATYQPPERAYVDKPLRAGRGAAATEAPRGVLYHRYEVAADGSLKAVQIAAPTSQNQGGIEAELRDLLEERLAHEPPEAPLDPVRVACEQTIRNFDPCISCATHFLRLEVERR